jgi:hypothetical protein
VQRARGRCERMVVHPETDHKRTIRTQWVGKRRPPRNACRQKRVIKGRRSGRHRHASSNSLRELTLQELSQLRCRSELRDGIEFLKRRCECIRVTPDRSWLQFCALTAGDE